MASKTSSASSEVPKREYLFRSKKSLAGQELTPQRKFELCKAYSSLKESEKSLRKFASFHGVHKSSLDEWVHIYLQHKDETLTIFEHSKVGRPEILDDEGKEIVKGKLLQLGKQNNHVKLEQFEEIVLQEAEVTATARGKSFIGRNISKSTSARIIKDIGITPRKAQTKTTARVRAEADPRNVITMGVMIDVFCKNLGPEYIFNWDATQYEVDPKGKLKVLVVREDNATDPITVESNGGLSYFIKHFHLHNAAGTIAPPVYVIANDALNADTFSAHKIPGMGYNNEIAWLCFSKTRSCNTAFFTWYIREVILPFVSKVRGQCEEFFPVNRFKRPFLYCDGENSQISSIQTPEVLSMLSDAGVDVGKTPASCSGILQASDVSNTFKGIKTRLKNLTDQSGLGDTQILVISKILAPISGFTNAKRKSIINAFEKVVYAVKNSTKPESISSGYARTGQYPINFNRTLKLARYSYSKEDMKTIRSALPQLRKTMAEKGQISEAVMDKLKIVNVAKIGKSRMPNDEKTLMHQRAVVMNAETCIKKYQERLKLSISPETGDLSKSSGQKRKNNELPAADTSSSIETAQNKRSKNGLPILSGNGVTAPQMPVNVGPTPQTAVFAPNQLADIRSTGGNEPEKGATGPFTRLHSFFSK